MNRLINRLEEIGLSLKAREHSLALLGLGSVGISRERLDEYSDLDFFVFCEEGYKKMFLEDLSWLSDICPLTFVFRNTIDGYKVLFSDGIFGEFAIFTPSEISNIPFTKGKIIWKKEGFDEDICQPKVGLPVKNDDVEYIIGEALTNLYVGLQRYHRGELLSAYKFIQEYAFSQVLKLMSISEDPKSFEEDPFSLSRRFEFRFPQNSQLLNEMLLGYQETKKSASNILEYLDLNYQINQSMKKEILNIINKNR